MKEIESWVKLVSDILSEVAEQAAKLGIGLQNAAPADKSGVPSNSVLYLLAIAEELVTLADGCKKISDHSTKESHGPQL